MKLSTKGRYGTRAMVDLGLHQDAGPVNLRQIAGRQGVSRRYLEQIMVRLTSHGLVRPVRGRGGGFALSRPPSQIPLADIVEALEGPINVVDCVSDPGSCDRASSCATRDVWAEVANAIAQHLGGITLEDLCQGQRKKQETQATTYHI